MIIKQFNFHQEPQHTWHTKSNNSKYFERSPRSRLLVVISAFININIDLGLSKNRKSNKQTHQSDVCKNNCSCARNILSFNLLHVNEIAKNGCFVVKRYAVHEAKTWKYAVRKAEIRRHAVRKGVSPAC